MTLTICICKKAVRDNYMNLLRLTSSIKNCPSKPSVWWITERRE